MRYLISILLVYILSLSISFALPSGFVYLHDVDPSILQDIRYAQNHNVVGRPIAGYYRGECILTYPTALALARIQKSLLKKHYSLKVYDCYRPTKAVEDFFSWANQSDAQMKNEFYPHTEKKVLFEQGFFARRSGHSRGSTVDLTIVKLPVTPQPIFHSGDALAACSAEYRKRYPDNSIDMGTGYDCMDEKAESYYQPLGWGAAANKLMLRNLMMENKFEPYDKEWWHFTLADEPYADTYFNFDVR